jgi:hypothetical protein
LILSATYGLLVTTDRGASWQYVCEAAYGVADLPLDARVAVTSEGALLAGIYSGVARAQQSPCNFDRTLGFSKQEAVPDFTLAASRPGRVVAIHVALPTEGVPSSQLYRSDDDGRSWRALGKPLPEVIRTSLTVDVAPSDTERLYVSGLGADGAGVMLRSEDGGESFDVFSIPTNATDREFPYIAAVDPENPDQVYVRTDVWSYDPEEQLTRANDALLYSDDGGASFTELLRAGGKLFGFAFSPDSSELLVGYGDPIQFSVTRVVDQAALGIYRAPKGSSSFEMRYAGPVGCLTWTGEGVYACTMEADTGFSLGLIRDTDFDLASPASFEPLVRLRDVAGPIECEACASGDMCRDYWKATCNSWGRDDCLELKASECSNEAGAAGAPTAGNATGGVGPAPGASGGLQNAADVAGSRGGCACRLREGHSSAQSLMAVIALAAMARFRRNTESRSARPAKRIMNRRLPLAPPGSWE